MSDKRPSIYVIIDARALEAVSRLRDFASATRRPSRYGPRYNVLRTRALLQIKPTLELRVLSWAISAVLPNDVVARGGEEWAREQIYKNLREWEVDDGRI